MQRSTQFSSHCKLNLYFCLYSANSLYIVKVTYISQWYLLAFLYRAGAEDKHERWESKLQACKAGAIIYTQACLLVCRCLFITLYNWTALKYILFKAPVPTKATPSLLPLLRYSDNLCKPVNIVEHHHKSLNINEHHREIILKWMKHQFVSIELVEHLWKSIEHNEHWLKPTQFIETSI